MPDEFRVRPVQRNGKAAVWFNPPSPAPILYLSPAAALELAQTLELAAKRSMADQDSRRDDVVALEVVR